MSSTALRQAVAVVLEDADRPAELLDTAEHVRALKNIETLSRILPALAHEHINELREHATAEELGGSLRNGLANQLGIRRSDAARRIEEAADLAPRTDRRGVTAQVRGDRRGTTGRVDRRRAHCDHPRLR